jgi:3-oxoacyl-[acyl-carrier-protein] synthase-3
MSRLLIHETGNIMNNHHSNHHRNPRIRDALKPRSLRYAHLTGWGMDVPEQIMPNADFEPLVHKDADWIFTKTGIRERRIAQDGETATPLAIRAAERALNVAHKTPGDIDLILVATSTPEYIFPSTASMVQGALGATHAGASDLCAACSGFVYALDLAANKIRSGSINTALVIGAETMSRVVDWSDYTTCILFADGAGAVVLEGSDIPGGVLTSVLRSDGAGWDLLTLPTVNSQQTYLKDGQHEMHRIYMQGRAVREFAIHAIAEGIQTALDEIGLTPGDLDLLIPHQANQRILDAAAELLQFPPEKMYSNIDRYGNTSAASIPMALAEAVSEGRLHPGDLLGLIAFGGGLSWSAAVVEWNPEVNRRTASKESHQERLLQAEPF